MVRLNISVPPLAVSFLWFFCVFLILDYDPMCSRIDFTQEKVIFIQLLESPILPYRSPLPDRTTSVSFTILKWFLGHWTKMINWIYLLRLTSRFVRNWNPGLTGMSYEVLLFLCANISSLVQNGFWLVLGTLLVFLGALLHLPLVCPWCTRPGIFFAMVLQGPWYAHLLRMQCTMYSVLAC